MPVQKETTMSGQNKASWYVMTLQDLRLFRKWLKDENARRLMSDNPIVEPFYPSDYLRSDKDLCDDFSNYVFLKATENGIKGLMEDLRASGSSIRLRHYLDTDNNLATVPNRVMQEFLDACIKLQGKFEITPPISSIEPLDKVLIKSGPFSGTEALVLHVQFSQGTIHLELAIQLVAGVMNIRMNDVDKKQIDILNRQSTDAMRADFIEYTQNNLLLILEHRVKRTSDYTVVRRDANMLTRLYRYRFYEIKNEAASLHFLALMLMCAHLCRHAEEEACLRGKALDALVRLNSRSESKAATDTRAYLWIALYISTHDPAYRDAAKQYIRDHQPKSAKLRRYVALIRKGVKV